MDTPWTTERTMRKKMIFTAKLHPIFYGNLSLASDPAALLCFALIWMLFSRSPWCTSPLAFPFQGLTKLQDHKIWTAIPRQIKIPPCWGVLWRNGWNVREMARSCCLAVPIIGQERCENWSANHSAHLATTFQLQILSMSLTLAWSRHLPQSHNTSSNFKFGRERCESLAYTIVI